jgi:hypothetical protein
MKWLGCLMGLGLVAGVAIESAGCTAPFTAGAGTGGASGSSAQTSGASPNSGTGGAQCAAVSCAKGEYCNPDIAACEPCATSARFQFDPPVMQALTLPITGASALYPRFRSDMGELFLVQQDNTHHDQIVEVAYAAGKSPPWGAATLLGALAGTHQDSGPLYLADSSILAPLVNDDALTKPGMPVLLFDSDRQVGDTKVFVVSFGTPPEGPVLVSLPGDAAHESSIAVAMAASPPRFWWISDAGPAPADAAAPLMRLVTATVVDTAPTNVLLTLDGGCAAGLPATPWVTPAGDRLLFASAPCGMESSSATHLYQVPIGSAGKETDNAKLVFTDGLATTDTTPTLTPDQCTLLFSRVDLGGTAQIFAAARN